MYEYIAAVGFVFFTLLIVLLCRSKSPALKHENVDELIPEIKHTSTDLLQRKWVMKYKQLVEFINNRKRMPSSKSLKIEERSLGYWCIRQRALYRFKTIDKYRMEQLNKLPEWKWNI
jgi:IS5 family transposase